VTAVFSRVIAFEDSVLIVGKPEPQPFTHKLVLSKVCL